MATKLFKILEACCSPRCVLLYRPPLSNSQQIAPLSKTMEKKLKEFNIPDKPKRPLTPFFMFMTNIRPVLKQKYPDLKLTDIAKKVSAEWETVNEEEKKRLQAEHDNHKASYTKKMLDYESKLTEEQKDAIKSIRSENKHAKEKRKMRKQNRELQKPKKAPTSFVLFMKSKVGSKGDTSFKEWQKEIAEVWKNMSNEEKEQYESESKHLQRQYKKDITRWEEKMIREGRTDVVRSVARLKNKN